MKNWLPSDPQQRERVKQAAMISVLIVGVFIFIPASYTSGLVGINDLRKQEAKLERELKGLEKELGECRAVLAREEALIRERSELAPTIEYYESRLPSTVEMPELLRELDIIANRTGQVFTKHERLPPVESGAILELPYRMEVHSDYHGFGRFLNAIENAERYAKVDDISIRFDPEDYVRHNVSLTLSTFKFDEQKLLASISPKSDETTSEK